MLETINITIVRSTLFVLTFLVFHSSISAKDCSDICGKVKEPSPSVTNHNELSQCEEEKTLASTR